MKRILSLFLALCLAFSLAAPVGAAGPEEGLPDDLPDDLSDDLDDLFWEDLSEEEFPDEPFGEDGLQSSELPDDLAGDADPAALDEGFAYVLAPNAAGGYTITFSGSGTLTRRTVQAALQADPSLPAASITEVIVAPGITAIGRAAFLLNTSITSVTLPEGLTEIEPMAFYSCAGLLSIRFPASVRTIGSKAFAGCTRLLSAALPAALASIGAGAFSNCIRLADVPLPAGLTSIGADAFWNCASLTAVTLPAALTTLGADAFAACDAIGTVYVCSGTLNRASESVLRARLTESGLAQAETVCLEWLGARIEDEPDSVNALFSADKVVALGLLAGGVLVALPIVSGPLFSSPTAAAPVLQHVRNTCTGAVNAVRNAAHTITRTLGLSRSSETAPAEAEAARAG